MSLMMSRFRSASAMSRTAPDCLEQALLDVEFPPGSCPPDLRKVWIEVSPARCLTVLSAIIKADLRRRFAQGERPQAGLYLDQFEDLKVSSDRVVSLVYEEFCLLRERGEAADPAEFCDRYAPWRDSLLAQLECHELLSLAAGHTPSAARLPSPGDRFRSFRLGELLGEGGYARVFLARDESLGDRMVALKVSTDRGVEAAIQGRLDHAHIVPVLSVTDDSDSGLRALCMPYRAGLTLDEVIARIQPATGPRRAAVLREVISSCQSEDAPNDHEAAGWLDFPARGTYAEGVAWIGSVVADALSYAHNRGVLHRDVKPANVLLTVREGPQLLDFNLAHAPHSADRAQTALRGGTLPYMAPEQLEAFLDAQKWDHVHAAAEVYSLGLLLRELLTGRRPETPNPKLPLPRAIGELLDLRRTEVAISADSGPGVPRGLESILRRCLAPRPEDRYPTAGALAADLRKFVDGRRRHRSRVVKFAAASVAILGLALAGRMLMPGPRPQDPAKLVAGAVGEINAGHLDVAAQMIAKALDIDTNSYEAYVARSLLHGHRNDWTASLKDARRAIEVAEEADPAVSPAHLARLFVQEGVVQLNLNDVPASVKALDHAIALDPENETAHVNLASALQRRDDLDGALKSLDNAIYHGEHGDSPIKPIQLAAFYQRKAEVGLKRANQIQFRDGAEHLALAGPYYRQADDDMKTALALFDRCKKPGAPPRPVEQTYTSFCLASDVKIALYDLALLARDRPQMDASLRQAIDLLEHTRPLVVPDRSKSDRLDAMIQTRVRRASEIFSPNVVPAPGVGF